MFEIFAGVYGKGDAIWLECAETLPLAKQRVNEIAAAKPGSYFVFDLSIATAEGLLYEVHATLLIERRSLEMEQARKEWEHAAEELKQTLALFRDLNVTPASPDGNLALRNARLNESRALQKYKAAVAAYVEELRANR
jgi:hypothetical protein